MFALLLALGVGFTTATLHAQQIQRPGPPRIEDFETSAGAEGMPEGWYNLRDALRADEGGVVGPHCLRFASTLPGRPARASRAFGVNGEESEALIVGVWVRVRDIQSGERISENPGLLIELLDENLRSVARGVMGPWNSKSLGTGWVHLAKRIAVPPAGRDAIMSVGLLGATGTLEVDGLTFELVPRGGVTTTNLILNGDVELGDAEPDHWVVDHGARRISPGRDSNAALEFAHSGSRAQIGLSLPPSRFESLQISLAARGKGLRGAGGADAALYFLDDDGRTLPGARGGATLFRWSGSFEWTDQRVEVAVPNNAARAVLQIEKRETAGSLVIDHVEIVAAPSATFGSWRPYQEHDDTKDWKPYEPAAEILAGSALDASAFLKAPAGALGRVIVKESRFQFEHGGRARFFGVALLPPWAFLENERADRLADHLARSGVNLVRLAGLDLPAGSGASLFDDSRDDTAAFDEAALARLDHLIAALKSRGIFIAIELQSQRRFRAGDGLENPRALPPGGGPAAAFDPALRKLALDAALRLLNHVNPETGMALRDDPALAWLTIAGELSLFDQIDDPDALPPKLSDALREQQREHPGITGRRFWQNVEGEQWTAIASALRKAGVKAPIAGSSHWRREPEFVAAQTARGLDLIEDRLYWLPPPWSDPARRAMLLDSSGGLAGFATRKRRVDRPFVVGEWADQTLGAAALPFEASGLLMMTRAAVVEDWDGIVRRGVARDPEPWGAAASGTGGGTDVIVMPEIINGIPPVFALLPHAASMMLRGRESPTHRPRLIADPRGRLAIETAYTEALAGWCRDRPFKSDSLGIEIENDYAVVAVSAVGKDPLKQARRLLVTAVARCQSTDKTWADSWRKAVADPGRPPLLMGPVHARVLWKGKGRVEGYVLDNAGKRLRPAKITAGRDGAILEIDGSEAALHWELIAP